MALGYLGLIFLVCALIFVLISFLLFFKKGEIVQKNIIFIIINIYPLILSFLNISSLPSNYVAAKIIRALPIIIAFLALSEKNKNFKLACIFSFIACAVSFLMLF